MTHTPDDLVKYAVSDSIATITLDSPHNRNALSRALIAGLTHTLAAAAADDSVRAVLIEATGTVFCSGADLSEAVSTDMAEGPRAIVGIQRAILAHPKPILVKIQGSVRAGGTGIVAAADIAVSTEEATFALTEVKLGLVPAAISLAVVPRMTSRAAAYTFLSGSSFTGAQAQTMGLITKAVPADKLHGVVDVALQELISGSPQGLRETKKLLNASVIADIDARGEELCQLSASLFASQEAKEAMLAFLSRNK